MTGLFDAEADSGIACPLAHDSYLINLASPKKALWKKAAPFTFCDGTPIYTKYRPFFNTNSDRQGVTSVGAMALPLSWAGFAATIPFERSP